MRIVFAADTDVDIKSLPKTAYGALGMKRSVVNGLPGPMIYFFRKGWESELPDAIAMPLVESGAAEIVAGRKVVMKEIGEE